MSNNQEWADKQEALINNGEAVVKRASDEALDYLKDVMENVGDQAWRKVSVETQAFEMGLGMAVAEHLIPVIYKDMEKTMHKRLKIPKDAAKMLRHIYIGRVFKNIIKEVQSEK